jgi:hypothetical protein
MRFRGDRDQTSVFAEEIQKSHKRHLHQAKLPFTTETTDITNAGDHANPTEVMPWSPLGSGDHSDIATWKVHKTVRRT